MMARLFYLDALLSQCLTLPPKCVWWQIARLVAHVGDGQYVFGGLGIVYLLAWLWHNSRLRWQTLMIALVVLAAMAIVTLIKFMVRRQRPHPPGEFVQWQYDKYSFPSGHAVRLAALAVITAFFSPWLGWLLVCVALWVVVARVAVGIHYVGDVIVGLCVGILVGRAGVGLLSLLPVFS